VCRLQIETPIIESAELFRHTLGESSDVVQKEMYTFHEARSGQEVTLRPEGTAGVMRAVLNAPAILYALPQHFVYCGPMFRYERPQRGRSRQFHQVGVESIGVAHPHSDCHVIELAYHLCTRVWCLDSRHLRLLLNTLGDAESRAKYRQVLEAYLTTQRERLSSVSQERLARGAVLRILDSKDPADQSLLHGAPAITNFLSSSSAQRFAEVQRTLTHLGVPYVLAPHLVRGLDYYTETCFELEFVAPDSSERLTILAGGRYDTLSLLLGHSRPIPSVGWAAGVERIAMLLPDRVLPENVRSIHIVPILADVRDESQSRAIVDYALKVCQTLRHAGHVVTMNDDNMEGAVGRQLRRAVQCRARFAVLIGDAELSSKTLTVKDLDTQQQITQTLSEFLSSLVPCHRSVSFS